VFNVIDIIVELIAISKNIKELTPELEDIYNPDEDYDFLLKKVLTYKPNINMPRKNGTNVLFNLALYNDFQTLNTILEYGAKIDIQDENGRTPLANMIKQGLKIKEKDERDKFIERLVNLLRYKKDVDVQDKEGRTVLHDAVIAGDNLVVEKLIRKKANLSIKDMHGRTALHHTKWTGNSQIAKWLIAGGVDINEPDNTGFTILNYATILGHAKLIMTLIDAGVLMNNRNPKSKKVAQFFKDREKNLDKMILENSSDAYVKSSLQTVVENLKKEVNEVLYGNVPKSDFSI
jgi:ankyrin repeat protein